MQTYTTLDAATCLISEKYDGIQARWDGQRLVTRDGNAIAAPAWFTAGLPNRPLTGELWAGRGRFEDVLSICMAAGTGDRWTAITLMVFDELIEDLGPHARCVQRWRIATTTLEQQLKRIVDAGGEGLVIRDDGGIDYKMKPQSDDDALVVGYTLGKGRNANRCGALLVEDREGRRFRLGIGLTDYERDNPPAAGTVVEFAYEGRTKNGVPRFARFTRQRAETTLAF